MFTFSFCNAGCMHSACPMCQALSQELYIVILCPSLNPLQVSTIKAISQRSQM